MNNSLIYINKLNGNKEFKEHQHTYRGEWVCQSEQYSVPVSSRHGYLYTALYTAQ